MGRGPRTQALADATCVIDGGWAKPPATIHIYHTQRNSSVRANCAASFRRRRLPRPRLN